MTFKTAEDYTRKISTDEDFMKYNSDDLLYGTLQYLSTFHPELGYLYITKAKITKNKKEIYDLCNLNAKTLRDHLKRLQEKGLIKEKKIYIGQDKTEYDCYVFSYQDGGHYQIVNNEMLWYIVSTRNKQAVRIYTMLLDWYDWKSKEGSEYIFTNENIIERLGYSTNGKTSIASSMVSNILESFKREGVIDYQDEVERTILPTGKEINVYRKRLTFVATSKLQLQ